MEEYGIEGFIKAGGWLAGSPKTRAILKIWNGWNGKGEFSEAIARSPKFKGKWAVLRKAKMFERGEI